MVKWIHIADVHLGASPDAGDAYSKVRPQELWDTFVEVIDICEREQTDLLLIAGDLFHRQPLKKELKEVDYYFSRLSRTKVVLIAGNHDFLKQDSYYRSFQWSSNVYPLFDKEPECVIFEDLDVAVTGFSYESREILTPFDGGIRAEGDAKYEILLVHGGDEKHLPIQKSLLEKSGFDYIAMGLGRKTPHQPQRRQRIDRRLFRSLSRREKIHGRIRRKSQKKRICRNNYGPQTLSPGHKLPECRSQRDRKSVV